MKKILVYTLPFVLLAGTAFAQMPTTVPVGNQGSQLIQSEIDQLLRVSENDIMAGLKDSGIDVGALLMEKVKDGLMETLADATVYAPLATKILKAYQQQKNKDLAEAIEKLKQTWQDGQQRINKIRYQDFKVKYAYQQAMNKAPSDVLNGRRRQAINESVKALWTDGLPVAITVTDPANLQLLRNEIDANYSNEDSGWVVLASARSKLLVDDRVLKAKLALVDREGQTAYLSPADRLRLLREIDRESKARRTTLLAMNKLTTQGLDAYKYQHNRRIYQRTNLRTQSYN